MELIARYLEADREERSEIFMTNEVNDLIFWVNHHEADDQIVDYCENILNTGKLSAELFSYDHNEKSQLNIMYQHKTLSINFEAFSLQNKDQTLTHLNHILSPDYEIRLVAESLGGDALAFFPQTQKFWQHLDHQHTAEIVHKFFIPIELNMAIFTMPKTEVHHVMQQFIETTKEDNES